MFRFFQGVGPVPHAEANLRLTPWRLEPGELEPREPQRRLQGFSEEDPRSFEEAPRSCRFAIFIGKSKTMKNLLFQGIYFRRFEAACEIICVF